MSIRSAMPPAPLEAILKAMLTPEAASVVAFIAPAERQASLSAILAAFRQLRRGNEKLQDLCDRIGMKAVLERAGALRLDSGQALRSATASTAEGRPFDSAQDRLRSGQA